MFAQTSKVTWLSPISHWSWLNSHWSKSSWTFGWMGESRQSHSCWPFGRILLLLICQMNTSPSALSKEYFSFSLKIKCFLFSQKNTSPVAESLKEYTKSSQTPNLFHTKLKENIFKSSNTWISKYHNAERPKSKYHFFVNKINCFTPVTVQLREY